MIYTISYSPYIMAHNLLIISYDRGMFIKTYKTYAFTSFHLNFPSFILQLKYLTRNNQPKFLNINEF